MIAVIVEPALLAVPPIAESEEEIEAIIDRLTLWAKCVLNGGILRISQMSDTTDVLALSQSWPTGDNISALLDMYNLQHVYSSKEVSRLINTILERASVVKDLLGFEVTSCEEASPSDVAYPSQELKDAGSRALSTVASGLASRDVFLAPAINVAGNAIVFKGTVNDCSASSDLRSVLDVPFSVFGNARVVKGPQCVCDALKGDYLWNSAKDARDVHFAITIRALEISKDVGVPLTIAALPSFSIGSGFLDSLRETQSGPHSRFGLSVLECAARIVLGQPKNSLDIFATGPRSRSDLQRERARDKAKAFRTHVTKGSEGLRLAVWQLPSRAYEFANVSLHNDVVILEGDATRVVSRSWE